ncbi:putative lipopolysaccharide heptosyltransferase III [Mixta calida]|uniref:putative lipopolysaccharide heptosyltransferase III n=1 Tax=Mixta calida TaxID=665913 RepID=UPI00403AF608
MAFNLIPSAALRPRRVLIVKLRHHGDMLLITPVINALKQQDPSTLVDILLYEETRDMLAANEQINCIYGIDRKWKNKGTRYKLREEARLIRTLRQQRYDTVLNLADQWRSALITRLTGARTRIGFDFPKRRHPLWRYCHTILVPTENHDNQHIVEQNLSILTPLGLNNTPAFVKMAYRSEDWQKAQALLPVSMRDNYVVIQPTSRWFFKCWREDRMAAVIRALSAAGQHVVLTSGPDLREKAMIDTILTQCQNAQVISLAGQLTLRQLAALIDHARLFLGVDSVPMHMAAALNTPLVALFGPSKLVFWRPWGAKGKVIWAGDFGELPDPDTIDTNTPVRYLDLIPTEIVIAEAEKMLS